MPIYEYRCEACQHEMEALQKLSDAVLVECPNCKQPTLKKKVSAAGFRLKGGGWYETDFKTNGKKNIAGEGGAKASGTSGDSSASSSGSASSDSAKSGNSAKSGDGAKSGGTAGPAA